MKNIPHPRRVLLLGPPRSDLSGLVQKITGSSPPKDKAGCVAGSIHNWTIRTRYYSADVPIWIDEISDLDAWISEFSSTEAEEVVRAVGAWTICIDSSGTNDEAMLIQLEKTLDAIERIIERACGLDWEGVRLAVSTASATATNPVEDICTEHGFEYVNADATDKNEYGEMQGIDRIKECLESNDWQALVDGQDSSPISSGDAREELAAMKVSLLADGEDRGEADSSSVDQLEDFDSLIAAARGIKEMRPDLPLAERQRLQKTAIDQLVSSMMDSDIRS